MPVSRQNSEQSFRPRAALGIIYLPIILVAFQSLFRRTILQHISDYLSPEVWWLYWVFRAVLFLVFWMLLNKYAPTIINDKKRLWKSDDEAIRRQFDPLLGLRAFAFFLVFFGHWFFVLFAPQHPASTNSELIARSLLSMSPWGGLWVFFTISGYLMSKGFVSGRHQISPAGIKNFYHNRVLRIFPLYCLSIFIVAVLTKPQHLNLTTREGLEGLLSSVLMDVQDGGIIGSLWSVSTEFQFYLLVPLLFVLLSSLLKQKTVQVAGALTLVIGLSFLKLYLLKDQKPLAWQDYVYFPVLMNMDCFLTGMLSAMLVQNLKAKAFTIRHGIAVGYGLMLALFVFLSLWTYPEMVYFPGLPGSSTRPHFLSFAPGITAIISASIIIIFELAQRRNPKALFFWKVQTLLGTLTYSLYVWHEPVLISLRKIAPKSLALSDSLKFLPLGLFVVLAISLIFYHAIETRFDRKRTSVSTDKQTLQPPIPESVCTDMDDSLIIQPGASVVLGRSQVPQATLS